MADIDKRTSRARETKIGMILMEINHEYNDVSVVGATAYIPLMCT